MLSTPFRALTWKTVLFHLVGFGLAVMFFVLTVVGIAVSVGLLIIIIGFFLGFAVMWMIHGIAHFDAMFVSVLLDVEVRVQRLRPKGSFLDRLRELVTSPATWKRTAYILLKLPLEVVGFAVTVSALTSLALIATPFTYQQDWADLSIGDSFAIDTLNEAVMAAVLGVIAGWLLLFLAVVLGRVAAAMANSLLTDDSTAPRPGAVA